MHVRERVARPHLVARLGVHDDAHGVVDRILLALTARAEPHGRASDRQGAAARNRTAARRRYREHDGRGLQHIPGPLGEPRIAALRLEQLLERPQRRARGDRLLGQATPGLELDAEVGEHGHARRRSQHELAEVGRAAAGQHLARLGDLERIADGGAERRVHGRQLADGGTAGAHADVAHAHRQLARRGEVGHERALPHLDVQQDRVGAGRELLRHHRRRDQPGRRHRAGDVAQRVEQAIGGHEVVGLSCHGAADARDLSDQLVDAEPHPEARDRLQLVERAAGVSESAARELRHGHAHGGRERRQGDRRLVPHPAGRVLVDDRAPERREVDRRARVDHRLRQLVRLGVREPAPDDRHRPRAHLLGRDATGDVALDQPPHLTRRVLGAVALALDQLDGSQSWFSKADRSSGQAVSRLRAEPRRDGRAHVGELAVVPPGRRATGDVRDEQRVLPRMIRRGRRRVAAVIRGEHQQVVRTERREEVGDRGVDLLQAAVEALGIVAVAIGLVGLDEVHEHEALGGLARERDGGREAFGVGVRRLRLVDVAAGEDVADLADARDAATGLANAREVVRARRLEREVVAIGRAAVGARLALERAGDHTPDGMLAREHARGPSGRPRTAPRAAPSSRAPRSGRPSRPRCRRSTCRCAGAPHRGA